MDISGGVPIIFSMVALNVLENKHKCSIIHKIFTLSFAHLFYVLIYSIPVPRHYSIL